MNIVPIGLVGNPVKTLKAEQSGVWTIEQTEMSDGLISVLRECTRDEHEAVERAFDLNQAVRSISAYRSILEAFYSVFSPAEALMRDLAVWRRLGLSEADFTRCDAIERDIRNLGGRPPCPFQMPIESIAAGVGCAYVLQGSRLGGQIIAKQVRTHLGLTREGVEFFGGDGRQTVRTWQVFKDAVDSLLFIDRAETIYGAKTTFERVRRALTMGGDLVGR